MNISVLHPGHLTANAITSPPPSLRYLEGNSHLTVLIRSLLILIMLFLINQIHIYQTLLPNRLLRDAEVCVWKVHVSLQHRQCSPVNQALASEDKGQFSPQMQPADI